MKILRIQIRSVQNVGKVWIYEENNSFSFFGFREIDFVGVSFESGKRSGVIKEANTTQR